MRDAARLPSPVYGIVCLRERVAVPGPFEAMRERPHTSVAGLPNIYSLKTQYRTRTPNCLVPAGIN